MSKILSAAASATTSGWSGVRDLVSLKEGPWRWTAGIQAALANALSMVMFSVTGHLTLGLISSLGAFTALYGTTMPLRKRLRVLPFVAAAFSGASLLGVLAAGNAGLMIACATVVALSASILVFAAGFGPPGPMQFVLVASISARLADPARVGSACFSPWIIPVLVLVGALGAYMTIATPLSLTFRRRTKSEESHPYALFSLNRLDAEKATIIIRVVVAVAAASVLSVLFRASHSYWMVVVAAAVLQSTHSVHHTTIRAFQRVVGTLAGIVMFDLIRLAVPRGAWLIVVLVILQFAIEVVVARNYALALVFITPTALTIAAAGASTPGALIRERMVDTVIGAVVAMIVLWATDWIFKRGRRFAISFS